MLRIVLDTNQLIQALMRPPELATFMMAWQSSRFVVLCSTELLVEYQRVLNSQKTAPLIYPELRRAFQSHLMDDLEMVDLPQIQAWCRDPDDDKVIATALYGNANFLLTTDKDLQTGEMVALLKQAGIQISTLDDFITMLDALT